ncbi:MAG: hypothetical protein HKN09_05585 [Saprospiraceae bacterium]|nr:hypothetical protein [Saprospiraceae bacterium]
MSNSNIKDQILKSFLKREGKDQAFDHIKFDYESSCITNAGEWILKRIAKGRSVQIFCDSESTAQKLIQCYSSASWQALFNFKGSIAQNVVLDKAYNSAHQLMQSYFSWQASIQKQGELITTQIVNKMSLKDVGDQLLFVKTKVKPQVLNLPAAAQLSDYFNEELKFVKVAQDKYNSRFSYLEFQNPFVKNIFQRFSYQALHDYLESKLALLQNRMIEWEDNDRNHQISAAWQTKDLRDKLWRLAIDLEVYVIQKKSTGKLTHYSSLPSELQERLIKLYPNLKDQNIDELLIQIRKDISTQNSKITGEVWSGQPVQNDKQALQQLYTFLDNFQVAMKSDDVLRNFPIVKAAGMKFNLDILKQLIARIRAAMDFLENHKVYFEWLIYKSQLNPDRKKLLHFLEQQEHLWDETFKEIFLRNVFSQLRAQLLPLEILESNLRQLNNEIREASLKVLLQDTDNGVIKINLIEERTQQYSNAYDYIFINTVPDLTDLKNTVHSIMGWSDRYHTQLIASLKEQKDLDLHIDHSIHWKPVGSTSDLNHNEATKCALYLGQELFNSMPSFKIYELKNISIISGLTPYKNLKLIETIGNDKIKEIITDKTTDNLLPTILMPSEKTRLILLENGLFDVGFNTSLLHQIGILRIIEDFGIQIESLYTYNTTQHQVEDLFRLAHRILEMNAA